MTAAAAAGVAAGLTAAVLVTVARDLLSAARMPWPR